MLDIHQWVILLLIAAFVAQDTTAGPQLLVSEPLVAGPAVGWIAGDVNLGLDIGIAAQLIWSGAVPAGSVLFLDVNTATVCAVVVAVSAGKTLLAMALSLAWLIPVGFLGSMLTVLNRRLNGRLIRGIRPESDRGRLIAMRHLTGWAVAGARGMITVAIGVPLGITVVSRLALSVGPYVDPVLLWSGILGAGAGVAIGVTWRYGRGKAALLGALGVLGLWMVYIRPDR